MAADPAGVRYRIADVAIESPIVMPELPLAADGVPTWQVAIAPSRRRSTARWSHHWREANGRRWLSIGRDDDEHVLRFAGSASFRVSLDRRIIACEGASRVPPDTLRHLLLNQVMPLVLGSDRIVLHASAVQAGPGIVAFAGRGGAGKSTLAAALARAGATFVTDDAVVLDRLGSSWRARAIHGSLRLWPDAVGAVFGPRVRSSRVAHYTRKQRIEMAGTASEGERAAPLAAICVLAAKGHSRMSLVPIAPREAIVALTAASFHLDIHDRHRWRWIVDELAALVQTVPVFTLGYPRRMGRLAATAETILQHLLKESSRR